MATTPDEIAEMRGDVPKWTTSVFEGVRRGRNLTKDSLLAQIMVEWAQREIHVATMVQRLSRGNAHDDHSQGDSSGN